MVHRCTDCGRFSRRLWSARLPTALRISAILQTSGACPVCFDGANEVQGERRAEPARAMLSRSLHSRCISIAVQSYGHKKAPTINVGATNSFKNFQKRFKNFQNSTGPKEPSPKPLPAFAHLVFPTGLDGLKASRSSRVSEWHRSCTRILSLPSNSSPR